MADPSNVFKVERHGNILIILPQGPALQFQHKDVHLETNSLFRCLDEPGLLNVVVDLSAVDYVDSVIISSILRCLTKAKQKRGRSAFCLASENMRALLKCIQIGKLWPEYATRAEAIASLEAPPPPPALAAPVPPSPPPA